MTTIEGDHLDPWPRRRVQVWGTGAWLLATIVRPLVADDGYAGTDRYLRLEWPDGPYSATHGRAAGG
jgi:hypothetical protein